MADLGTSMAVASVVVGMLAIPAASQNLDAGDGMLSTPPNVSSSQNPKEVTVNRTTEGITKSIQTALSRFTATVSSDGANARLEGPATSLDVQRSPGKTTWNLKSSEGALEIEKTSKGIRKVAETAEGTLEIVKADGRTSKSFEGTDKKKVKSSMQSLEKKLEEKLKEARNKVNSTSKTENPVTGIETELEISVSPETPEYVKITNTGSETELDNWKLQNNNPDTHEFEALELNSSDSVRVYSAEESESTIQARRFTTQDFLGRTMETQSLSEILRA